MSGKKNKSSNLGRSLIKDRFRPIGGKRKEDSYLHTADINDGYDWGRLNLQSVTEESSFQEFLSTAELAGTEFHAEKLNIKFVSANADVGLLSKEEQIKVLQSHKEKKSHLKIPRRPKWSKTMSPQELEIKEKDEFLEWRRQLMLLQETEDLIVTPYEKNLEFWRSLWRVIERSDIVVQIVDARNPLLFRCEDVEKYVKEVDPEKQNLILINKADYLSRVQREQWAKYFSEQDVKIVFFSARESLEKSIADSKELSISEEDDKSEHSNSEDETDGENETLDTLSETSKEKENTKTEAKEESNLENVDSKISEEKDESEQNNDLANICVLNNSEILSREELITFFKSNFNGKTHLNGVTTVGFIGYPNVGKSSTINALLMDKKVSVSKTPGKTKHFQTLYLEKDLLLCDCPGLVMPSFVCTKADMVLNGILPIDQLRDYVPPVALISRLIPRHIIEHTYGIMIPPPREGEDPERPPTASELLDSYGYNRGFMTQNGQPDNPRSARYILKDFVSGKLLYCFAPPDYNQDEFHTFPNKSELSAVRTRKPVKEAVNIDKILLQPQHSDAHIQRNIGKKQIRSANDTENLTESIHQLGIHTKKKNKATRHKKREKLRRVYAHLDQH